MSDLKNKTLGVCGNHVALRDGTWFTHHSFGKLVDRLADDFGTVRYFAFRAPRHLEAHADYALTAPNLELLPGASWSNTVESLKRPHRLIAHYYRMVRTCDALFLRGSLPALWAPHFMDIGGRIPIVHWVVGDPVSILNGESRGYGNWLQRMGVLYARCDRVMTQIGARLSDASVLANGDRLAHIFSGPRTVSVVSTSITEDDITERAHTFRREEIRLLYVGYIRPEKGLEYLIRALPRIASDRRVCLRLVGSWTQFPAERARLVALAETLGVADRITWAGYVAHGPDLHREFDESDVFVLPSVSEGTPRVLVEARARGLPVVATNVGGVPCSVRNDVDGLLVAPRDADALAGAIARIVTDDALRQRLIEAGRTRVRELTVERFAETIVAAIRGMLAGRAVVRPRLLRSRERERRLVEPPQRRERLPRASVSSAHIATHPDRGWT